MKTFSKLFLPILFCVIFSNNTFSQIANWLGTTDSVFSNPLNWSINGLPGVPDSSTTVMIVSAPFQPTITTDQKIYSINIAQNATLKILAETLFVYGDIHNAGAIIPFHGSTVEFRSPNYQFCENTGDTIFWWNVFVNKPASHIFLTGSNGSMIIDSTLRLKTGHIITHNLPNLEVYVRNNSPSAILDHNALSYIDGKLRRQILGPITQLLPYSLDFPLGDSLLVGGYELANVTFLTTTDIDNLLGEFSSWPMGAPVTGPAIQDCGMIQYNNLPIFNHGYWTFQRSDTAIMGSYQMSLYNTGFLNNTGLYWTISVADLTSNLYSNASWYFDGICDLSSTATITKRDLMNSQSLPATAFNLNYSVVQSNLFPTGISEKGNSNQPVLILPNPASIEIDVRFFATDVSDFSLDILDITGRKLITEKFVSTVEMNSRIIDISKLSGGLYFLIIHNSKDVFMKSQFVKN